MILVTRVLGHCVFVFRSLPKKKQKKHIIYGDLLSKVLEQESPGGEYEEKQGQQEEAVTGVLENIRHCILPKQTARLNWSGKDERVLTDLNVLEINTTCLRKGMYQNSNCY